ncbi:hypothetical protein HMPREF9083_0174 [Dialister micraerophilus DSM 19965]|uniref:Uncharacterized protein n=1 Tax=Dialister micraerophilus DSM 19965 TaxID=888062 RepID=F2BVF7_9FIRM|nr:hypothetical protein HMPREF9083_0174 [Dialister micraerophilus DSM 19965]
MEKQQNKKQGKSPVFYFAAFCIFSSFFGILKKNYVVWGKV